MLRSIKRQVIKEKFTELYLDHVSDFDIEFLYNYIMNTNKVKELYQSRANNTGSCSRIIEV